MITQKISPFPWFDDQAEEAATFYTEIFPRSRIVSISRYGQHAFEVMMSMKKLDIVAMRRAFHGAA